MSLPADMGSLRKQFYFTMLYTTANVFSFMNSTIYWFITRQQHQGGGDSREPSPPQESGAPSDEGIVWGWGADTDRPTPMPKYPCG
jgi:hypothetical protein